MLSFELVNLREIHQTMTRKNMRLVKAIAAVAFATAASVNFIKGNLDENLTDYVDAALMGGAAALLAVQLLEVEVKVEITTKRDAPSKGRPTPRSKPRPKPSRNRKNRNRQR